MNSTTGEFAKIDQIIAKLGASSARVKIGIGDDAALVDTPTRGRLLLCSDCLVENTHFKVEWTSPHELGHKALAVVLSDIAAMNGKPLYALVTLALPPSTPSHFIDQFYSGMKALALLHQVDIVGGDLSSSRHEIFIDVAVIGATESAWTRSGAKPGDIVAVSGPLGSAAAGLFSLENKIELPTSELTQALLRPQPRLDLCETLKDCHVTSAIDLSDGLSSELHHIAKSSGVGLEIDEAKIPFLNSLVDLANSHSGDYQDWIWNGGEDYQLLLTLNADSPLPPALVTIGKVTSTKGQVLALGPDGSRRLVSPSGWNHFPHR